MKKRLLELGSNNSTREAITKSQLEEFKNPSSFFRNPRKSSFRNRKARRKDKSISKDY
ncbi:hypothetical protein Fleli_3280 [Bernardetia litoralis DSM 6794]|uniref:Uncharacterized protein n=1 Tax=Bernardetia litoralis (strain ATCC 23117 / DSM 6794 / NBRC 15988 / NCIMB 1366 / Fx l1 / Sio-4) TaxID=880071 RepID=I4ANS5_BERLS|nr:hypothetical protein [Bernardetia litoralis]AFM05610.1 hypothetical protein Fleli_3280 [Bernardetia litoralis DSM 6794]